ncbi:MAG: LLM class F420-dependent oxidoreductase [Novosphingobium sp.]|nr:LLM class F420-dependent oxidoreductase [Novosphingobium sp.]MCP5400896.1 LLM class F420-dependent oxidoreductase [Novosphingobium sp.]
MKIGAIFPHDTIEPDVGAIRTYTVAVEEMGFNHIISYDHVMGANAESRPGWQGYDLNSKFHEPIALLSYIAGVAPKLGLATGVMILPQRQTVLVAKQSATLDLLTNGNFRLGIGTGWNEVEYEALGMDFKARGKVFDDQIDVLRALWTERAVTVETVFHTITDAGLWPMPVQRPIPLWLGGGGVHPYKGWAHVDRVLRRIAQKGDGWMPTFDPDETGMQLVERFREYCREVERDPADVPIEALLLPSMHPDWPAHVEAWKNVGAVQMCTNVAGPGIDGVDANIKRLDEVRQSLSSAGLWTPREDTA